MNLTETLWIPFGMKLLVHIIHNITRGFFTRCHISLDNEDNWILIFFYTTHRVKYYKFSDFKCFSVQLKKKKIVNFKINNNNYNCRLYPSCMPCKKTQLSVSTKEITQMGNYSRKHTLYRYYVFCNHFIIRLMFNCVCTFYNHHTNTLQLWIEYNYTKQWVLFKIVGELLNIDDKINISIIQII